MLKIFIMSIAIATISAPAAELLASKNSTKNALFKIRRDYRKGKINISQLWKNVVDLTENRNISAKDRSTGLLTQAFILRKSDYPIISSIYAAQAIMASKDSFDDDISQAWKILKQNSEDKNIQNVLVILASNMLGEKKLPPYFKGDWHFFRGMAFEKDGKLPLAQQEYKSVGIRDRYYANSQFNMAMMQIEEDKVKEAISSLVKIIHPSTRKHYNHTEDEKKELYNVVKLNLARLYYEQKDFEKSFRYYRAVTKDSIYFYDALAEQAWPFFLNGYPQYALGAIHGASSPFFANKFNPEAEILKSIIFYWICDFESARNALADFIKFNQNKVASLKSFLETNRLGHETAYELFENYISGVSEKGLGVSHDILNTAATKPSLSLIRDQYADLIEEENRLLSIGIYGEKSGTEKGMGYISRLTESIKKDIGSIFLSELTALQSQYDRLYDQSEFLYIELLMSQKDQILGKNLHGESKISSIDAEFVPVKGWGKTSNAWNQSDKKEYWWDEVGFYVYDIEPQCNIK